jgi:hypothetical protein
METVTLVETSFGVEVRCIKCKQLLDRVPDQRTAYWRCEQYAMHSRECSVASAARAASAGK